MNYKKDKKTFYTIWYDNGEAWEDHETNSLNLFFKTKEEAVKYLEGVILEKVNHELVLEKKDEDYPYPNACWKSMVQKNILGETFPSILFVYDQIEEPDYYGEGYLVKEEEFTFIEVE